MIDKDTKATPPTQIPSEVMEAMELVCDKLAQLMPYPAPQEVIDIRTWLAQQRGQG